MNRGILVIGPTGAGKTPLGELLARKGLWHARCFHFDFGQRLRRIAAGKDRLKALSRGDLDVIRRVLRTGDVLENQHFHIAEAILRSFMVERGIGTDDFIVLNGLPRHLDQAKDVDRLIDVQLVMCLSCPAEVALRRIRTNAGGDRAERNDDNLESVERRLAVFNERTAPLLDHYRAMGVRVEKLDIAANSSAEELLRPLERFAR